MYTDIVSTVDEELEVLRTIEDIEPNNIVSSALVVLIQERRQLLGTLGTCVSNLRH